jgi:hypothetical protein
MGIGEYDNYFYQNLFYKNETGPTSVKPVILDLIQYHKPEGLEWVSTTCDKFGGPDTIPGIIINYKTSVERLLGAPR